MTHMRFLYNLAARAKGRELLVLTISLCALVALVGIASPQGMASFGAAVSRTAFDSLGWLFLSSVSFFLLLVLWLAFSRYGRLTLGQDGDDPEFSTLSWLAMLFAAGMGSGLLFWGVAEPLIHYADPPIPPGGTPAAARRAMVQTNFHWGLHAWAVYCVGGLVLAYFGFRRKTPYLPGAPLRDVFSGRWVRPVASMADLIGVLAVATGVAGSLGAGILQLRTGLHAFAGLPAESLLVSVAILLVLVAAYLLSASTGLDRGIKWLSNINMCLAVGLLLFVAGVGPTSFLLDAFTTAVGDYIAALPELSLRLFPYSDLQGWTRSWTLTYFIWWIAWAPFVGVFIARISRGRTIRQFVLGVLLAPTAFSILWFAVFGGAGIHEELHGAGGLARLVSEDVTFALFALFDRLPLAALTSLVAVVLLFVFLVTSADSATYVLGMLTSRGSLVPSKQRKLAWGIVIGVFGGALMLTGSIDVLKSVIVTGAVPFTFVLLLQVVALLRSLMREKVPRRKAPTGAAVAAVIAVLAALGFTVALSGCGGGDPVRVGVKSFTEQEILGEMAVAMIRDAGIAAEAPVTCGDTYECHRALGAGEIDLMVEYTGTGWLLLGASLPPGGMTLDGLQELYQPLGLRWLGSLGLDNSYRLVISEVQSTHLGVVSIGGLTAIDRDIRVACPGEYLRRSTDGLNALARMYGLRLAPDPLVVEAPADRLAAVLDGRADVAVVYATDGIMADPRIVELADPRDFYPPYEAAFLVHDDALERWPDLEAALRLLQGQVSTETMRELNHAVQLQGRSASNIARGFLARTGLLGEGSAAARWEPDLLVLQSERDDLADFAAVARGAIREVYPERTTLIDVSPDPIDAVSRGKAKMAVVGAERFFALDGTREERIEAVAVLGFRALHLVTRPGANEPLQGRIGAQPPDTGGGRVADALLGAEGLAPTARSTVGVLLDDVMAQKLDAALVLTRQGDSRVARGIAEMGLALQPIDSRFDAERSAAVPYLRRLRIPAGVYPGFDVPLDTLGCQVVLAGPAPRRPGSGAGGPAAALPVAGIPLPHGRVVALADAVGVHEAPDTVLPTAWTRTASSRAASRNHPALDTLLNAFALLFLLWAGWLLVRRRPSGDPVSPT